MFQCHNTRHNPGRDRPSEVSQQEMAKVDHPSGIRTKIGYERVRTTTEATSVPTLAAARSAVQPLCGRASASCCPDTAALAQAPTESIIDDTAGTDSSCSTCQSSFTFWARHQAVWSLHRGAASERNYICNRLSSIVLIQYMTNRTCACMKCSHKEESRMSPVLRPLYKAIRSTGLAQLAGQYCKRSWWQAAASPPHLQFS